MTAETVAANDLITLAAETLHYCGEPGAGARLRDEHDFDRSGRCRGCPHNGTVAPRFPCLLRRIGEAAARLDEQAQPSTTRKGVREHEQRGLPAGPTGSGPVPVPVV